jgi:hypothetical protein
MEVPDLLRSEGSRTVPYALMPIDDAQQHARQFEGLLWTTSREFVLQFHSLREFI